MRKLLLSTSKFLAKHIWLYYLLNCTWGSLMTIIGLIGFAIMFPVARKTHTEYNAKYHYGYALHEMLNGNWGGLSLGMTTFVSSCLCDALNEHELGHTFQNAIFGPFMPFVVTIPSAIRYWYRHFKYDVKDKIPPTAYDDMWFEASATEIGYAVMEAKQCRQRKR